MQDRLIKVYAADRKRVQSWLKFGTGIGFGGGVAGGIATVVQKILG